MYYYPGMFAHRWNRNPRPRPQTFSKFVFLHSFSELFFLNWLSGALVGVGGSDFIGCLQLRPALCAICEG